MADDEGSPDTLELILDEHSLDYKPGEVVRTRGADYRIEQITHDSLTGKRRMFLLRIDLVVKPIVHFDENKIRVQVSDERPKNPKVL